MSFVGLLTGGRGRSSRQLFSVRKAVGERMRRRCGKCRCRLCPTAAKAGCDFELVTARLEAAPPQNSALSSRHTFTRGANRTFSAHRQAAMAEVGIASA